jgi:hypothetical protein
MRKPENVTTSPFVRAVAGAFGALGIAVLLAACGSSSKTSSPPPATTTTAPPPASTTAPTTTSKTPGKLSPAAKLILALAKKPKASTLPKSLRGSSTQATPLSAGSRKHHAAGAIVTTNGGSLVGYLVFKTRKDALGDLRAYPPNSGPNKIIARSLTGLPKPTYVLRALGNGYVVRYVVFVDGPVIVDTWAYGQKGKAAEQKLLTIVEENARWARARLVAARKTTG